MRLKRSEWGGASRSFGIGVMATAGAKGDLMEETIAEVKGELRGFFEAKAGSSAPAEGEGSEEAALMIRLAQAVCDQGLKMERSRRLDQGDLAVQLAPICGRAKTNPVMLHPAGRRR